MHSDDIKAVIKSRYKFGMDHWALIREMTEEFKLPDGLVWSEFYTLVDDREIKHPEDRGVVYLLGAPEIGYYKIGRTIDLDKRLATLRIQFPFKVDIVTWVYGNYHEKTERFFHDLFRDKRMNGEWFKLTEDDILLFDNLSLKEFSL